MRIKHVGVKLTKQVNETLFTCSRHLLVMHVARFTGKRTINVRNRSRFSGVPTAPKRVSKRTISTTAAEMLPQRRELHILDAVVVDREVALLPVDCDFLSCHIALLRDGERTSADDLRAVCI
jgi:hypothetical protein